MEVLEYNITTPPLLLIRVKNIRTAPNDKIHLLFGNFNGKRYDGAVMKGFVPSDGKVNKVKERKTLIKGSHFFELDENDLISSIKEPKHLENIHKIRKLTHKLFLSKCILLQDDAIINSKGDILLLREFRINGIFSIFKNKRPQNIKDLVLKSDI